MEHPDPYTVRCPTCRAEQTWSDTCRRCKSDLGLLREVAASYEQARRAFFHTLHQGHHHAALLAARRCLTLSDDPESRRLLALGALLGGDWDTAAGLARALIAAPTPDRE